MEDATLKSIVDAMAVPAMVLSPDLRILQSNADAEQYFDRRLVGIDVVRILRQPEVRSLLTRVAELGTRQTTDVVIHRTTARTFLVAVGPLRNGDPQRPNLLMTLTDISDQLDAERSRSTFVANVSHELRSPLTTLLGAVETLQGPARDNPKARERFLGLMQLETRRMSRLVGDLLNLAKQEAKEHRRPETPIDINRVLSQVRDALEASEDYREGRIQIQTLENARVRGSEDDLFEAFRNVVENALRYSPPDSEVWIEVTRRRAEPGAGRDRLIIEVRDFGDGIETAHLPHLTERFYRVDKGRSREMGGTGLGLAIVKHIVNRHEGRLSINSRTGKGTTVRILLPV